jgi:hypothetical protein
MAAASGGMLFYWKETTREKLSLRGAAGNEAISTRGGHRRPEIPSPDGFMPRSVDQLLSCFA